MLLAWPREMEADFEDDADDDGVIQIEADFDADKEMEMNVADGDVLQPESLAPSTVLLMPTATATATPTSKLPLSNATAMSTSMSTLSLKSAATTAALVSALSVPDATLYDAHRLTAWLRKNTSMHTNASLRTNVSLSTSCGASASEMSSSPATGAPKAETKNATLVNDVTSIAALNADAMAIVNAPIDAAQLALGSNESGGGDDAHTRSAAQLALAAFDPALVTAVRLSLAAFVADASTSEIVFDATTLLVAATSPSSSPALIPPLESSAEASSLSASMNAQFDAQAAAAAAETDTQRTSGGDCNAAASKKKKKKQSGDVISAPQASRGGGARLRKIVHAVAHTLSLQHVSVGRGARRCVVLRK
jgi:hypothetical protein